MIPVPEEEIQRAHDILVAFIQGDVPCNMTKEQKDLMTSSCDVLCWILGHEHNKTFIKNLNNLIDIAYELGYDLKKK